MTDSTSQEMGLFEKIFFYFFINYQIMRVDTFDWRILETSKFILNRVVGLDYRWNWLVFVTFTLLVKTLLAAILINSSLEEFNIERQSIIG